MKTTPRREEKPVRQDIVRQNLDGHYGRIWMPALAAALRYPSDCKNPQYAPTDSRPLTDEQDAA